MVTFGIVQCLQFTSLEAKGAQRLPRYLEVLLPSAFPGSLLAKPRPCASCCDCDALEGKYQRVDCRLPVSAVHLLQA